MKQGRSIWIGDVGILQVRETAIRQAMHEPDPYEREDYPEPAVSADPARLLRLWRLESAIRACWRI